MVKKINENLKDIQLKVAIGFLGGTFGGLNQHKIGIIKYSSHQIKTVPSKSINWILNRSNSLAPLYRKFLKKIGINYSEKGQVHNLSNSIFQLLMRKMSLDDYRIEVDDFLTFLYQKFIDKIGLNGYDIVHSHVSSWFINLCLRARSDSCKMVHTYHALHFEEDFPNGLQEWQKDMNNLFINIASKADKKISVAKWLQDYLYKTYSIRTEFIPNGFDLDSCKKANPKRFTKKFKVDRFVLFVGNSRPIKNPKSFIQLASRLPNVKFIMIGKQLDAYHLSKDYRISIPKNLILLGEMSHKNVLDAISACKVFVMTSKREGLPTVLLEAMGLRKTVVVPSHSGCKEVVPSEKYGFLYKPNSIDDLVEKTKLALVSNHTQENAYERVSQYYDWKKVIKKIDSLYKSCI